MTRSVHIQTHKALLEQPTLFHTPVAATYDTLRHTLYFTFWEADTLVYQQSITITTHPRDWHFKSRLIAAIKKEITESGTFRFTGWNKWADFKYSYVLNDKAEILKWFNQKSIADLFALK